MGIDRVLLEAMSVHARAAAATGQLAVSELVVSEEECCGVLSARTDALLWHSLVARRAWSDERYAAGLGRLWIECWSNPADKPAVHRKHDAGRCTGAQSTRAPGRGEQSSARTQLRVLPPCRCLVWSSPNRWPSARI